MLGDEIRLARYLYLMLLILFCTDFCPSILIDTVLIVESNAVEHK